MIVLVTGSKSFIGRNLCARLMFEEGIDVLTYSAREDDEESLSKKISCADFVFHLAGINRSENEESYFDGNSRFTRLLLNLIGKSGKATPVLYSSSVKAVEDSSYGKSKLEAERFLAQYALKNKAAVYNYRLPNVFGKWGRPNHNSVVATWCYNISRGLPVKVDDRNTVLNLVYVDDVVEEFLSVLNKPHEPKFNMGKVQNVYQKTLGEIYDELVFIDQNRTKLTVPRSNEGFQRALYATYLNYLPADKFAVDLKYSEDKRGYFCELFKTLDSGQVSVSTSAPGVTRGNHFHHTKNEKFIVVKGKALISLRNLYSEEVLTFEVSDERLRIVEMIPGYTHNIKNTGQDEMILLMWASEIFSEKKPDTYFQEI